MIKFRYLFAVFAFLLCIIIPKYTLAAHTLNYFHTSTIEEDGEEIFRIEVGMTGKNVKYETIVKPYLKSRLVVRMKDTKPGKLSRFISVKKELVEKIRLQEIGDNVTQIAVELNDDLKDDGYKVYTLERDKKADKPYRVVIDIKKPKKKVVKSQIEGVQGRAVVIDPGHGGTDSGAVGPTGVRECDVALSVSLKVRDALIANGASVRMTRSTDKDVYGPNSEAGPELQARVNVANFAPETDIFVSIHCNAFASPASHGMETYYFASSEQGKRLATFINEELAEAGGLHNRGVKTANFYVIKHSNMPATLLELGFVTNPREERLLNDDDYQNKLANAIVKGIGRYFAE